MRAGMNFSALFPLFLGILFFAAAVPEAQACRLVCNGNYDPDGIDNPLDGISYCQGSVEFEGCSGDEDTGTGGGGGGTPRPDLTTSGVTPQAATANVSQTYTVTVTNGTAVLAGTTYTRFERATNTSGAGATTIGAASTGVMTGGASRNVSLPYTHTAAETIYLRACADSASVVLEANESNNCGPWTAVTVSGPSQPDLTTGSASAPGASYGGTSQITATIQNIGGVLAAASNVYYQLTAPNSKGNTSGILPISSLAPSGSTQAAFSYKFSYEGNYSVRFCADWYGEVAESNEDNNCGSWSDIYVISPPPVSGSVSCTVNSSAVTLGQSVTYTAHPVGAASSPYSWSSPQGGSYGTAMTATRTFGATGTFNMSVSATDASNNPANCPAVTVTQCPGTPDAEIEGDPTRLQRGGTTTLNWSASAINSSCTITGPGVNQVVNAVSCSIPDGTVDTPPISTQSTYTISCDNGAITDSVIVNVVPGVTEF